MGKSHERNKGKYDVYQLIVRTYRTPRTTLREGLEDVPGGMEDPAPDWIWKLVAEVLTRTGGLKDHGYWIAHRTLASCFGFSFAPLMLNAPEACGENIRFVLQRTKGDRLHVLRSILEGRRFERKITELRIGDIVKVPSADSAGNRWELGVVVRPKHEEDVEIEFSSALSRKYIGYLATDPTIPTVSVYERECPREHVIHCVWCRTRFDGRVADECPACGGKVWHRGTRTGRCCPRERKKHGKNDPRYEQHLNTGRST